MRIRLFGLILFAFFSHVTWAQGNPFRSLRDGAPERIHPIVIKDSLKRYSLEEAQIVGAELDNYYLAPMSSEEFRFHLMTKSFVQREIKSCKKNIKNIVLYCEKYATDLFLVRLRVANILDDVSYMILVKGKEAKLDLRALDQKYFFINLKREEINPAKAYEVFDFNPMAGKDFKVKVDKLKGLTPRQRLYLVYTPDQILKMAEIIKKASTIMNSKSVQIIIDEDGDGKEDMDPIVLSFSGKYRLAIKYIRHLIEVEKTTGQLIGKNPTYTDLLCSAMEVGYFNANELETLLSLPELQDPKAEPWKKAGKIAWVIAKAGIMAIPGFGPLIAIPIIIVEAIIEGQRNSEKHADNSDDIF